jgi:hypothetical protein
MSYRRILQGPTRATWTLLEFASGDNDRITVDVNMDVLSTGTVGGAGGALVYDGGKKAKVRFAIHRGTNSTSMTGISAAVNTSSKKSVAMQTANVVPHTGGKDTIIADPL